MAKSRTLFSVIHVTGDNGETWMQVDWNPDIYEALDRLGPNGELTDRLVDMAEELVLMMQYRQTKRKRA